MAKKNYRIDTGTFDDAVVLKIGKNGLTETGSPVLTYCSKANIQNTLGFLHQSHEKKNTIIFKFLGHIESISNYYLHEDGRIILSAVCDVIEDYAKDNKKQVEWKNLPCSEEQLANVRKDVEREALEYVTSQLSKEYKD